VLLTALKVFFRWMAWRMFGDFRCAMWLCELGRPMRDWFGRAAVIANMTPFRGPSADVGTAWEMGFARGLALPVYAHSNIREAFMSRTLAALGMMNVETAAGSVRDANGMTIEHFGLADNLMLESAIAASGGVLILNDVPLTDRFSDLRAFEECVKALRQRFG
jgi:hypothetical protein